MRSLTTLIVGLVGLALLAAAGWAQRDDIASRLIRDSGQALTAAGQPDIEVSHSLRQVVLEGEVPDEAARQAATDTTLEVRGVRTVDNRLRVAAAPPPALEEVDRPAAEPAPPAAVDCQQQLDERLEGEEVFFEINEAAVHAGSFGLLDSVVEIVQGCSEARLRIEGSTDAQGSEDYNMALSQRRAESVMRYLIGKGVSADRLTAVAYGESRAASETARSERRVEFKVEGVQ